MTLREFRQNLNEIRKPHDEMVARWHTWPPFIRLISWPFCMPLWFVPSLFRWPKTDAESAEMADVDRKAIVVDSRQC